MTHPKTFNQLGLTRLPVDRLMTEAEIATHDAEMTRLNERLKYCSSRTCTNPTCMKINRCMGFRGCPKKADK